MTTQPSDGNVKERKIDGLSVEDWNYRQARRVFIAVLLTPVWWVGTLIFINLTAEIFPTTSADSTFVFVTWSLLALVFTITLIFTGASHARQIKEFEARKGLWMARAASVLGVVFTVLTIVLIFAIFTGEDASTRPGL